MAPMYGDRDRDAGFCSAEDDEDLDTEMHSPTDVSEDSVDVKVKPITSLNGCVKSKRKCAEPKKFGDDVKRRAVDITNEVESECNPFRPWSLQTPSGFIPKGYQEEPLSLVLRDSSPAARREDTSDSRDSLAPTASRPRPQDVVRLRDPAVRRMLAKPLDGHAESRVQDPEDTSERLRTFSVESLMSERPGTSMSVGSASVAGDLRRPAGGVHQSQQRNYKNMTRERRVEANARERTRVHTISAAFDTLRRAVPAYSHNQKLSKLSVLRIACSYILTLSRVAGDDYSADGSRPSLADCVDNVSRTIQLEGKLRKKKEDE